MFGLAFAMGSAPGGAAGGAAGGGMAAFQQIIPLVFMFAIFYFLLIRPQQKKAKEHKALLESMKKGDNVITAGGVHGKVSAVENDLVTLEIADKVNIKITKSYIAAIKKD
ncbi:MAG: preprotein translocase subunit YajC [Desulfuromonadaceae bacterium]|nr:preprotein translocase subunit YajC [Desulfuromonadaceae bacterium]MDD5107686.1 preprotein translocase subunit YajC [Desulfuromonadaceae bacterium]